MLNDYKSMYAKFATQHLGTMWKTANKSWLFRQALEYKDKDDTLYNAYVSAIIVRYWGIISKYCAISGGAYTDYDVYVWLVDAALWTISYRPWTKPELKLYNDENGPDKCMNACLKSARAGFYQWSNAKKRKDSFTKLTSLEHVLEVCGDAGLPDDTDAQAQFDVSLEIKDIVIHEFTHNNMIQAFVIDGICNSDCIDGAANEDGSRRVWFNQRKLSKHIRKLNSDYCKIFAHTYSLPLDQVMEAKEICNNLSTDRVNTVIRNCLTKLSKNALFKEASMY